MILLGLSTLVYSFFEISTWSALYFARDYYCIERFRSQTKASDLVSCVHNFVKGAFGVALIVSGLRGWIPEGNLGLASMAIVASFCLLVVDVVVMEVMTRVHGLREQCVEIEKQWKKERYVTKEHDHEVNLYRGTVRVTRIYPKHVIVMGVSTIVLLLFFI